ncbi:MAG: transporter [Pseudomonadota bacterium]|nr:transporter [Pseudomonadota bacterium]
MACSLAHAQTPGPTSHIADPACKEAREAQGSGPVGATVACVVERVFQSRVRYRAVGEPVSMTVGSPPMQTDDSETPGPGRWEVNLVLNGEFAGSDHAWQAPLIDINYGIGDDLQLKYELPYMFTQTHEDDSDGTTRAHGIGDSVIGLKYRFFDDKKSGLSLALYPQVKFRTPGAPSAVSENQTLVTLPFILVQEFERASLTANLGVESDDRRHYFGSVGMGTRLSQQNAVLGEIVARDLNLADEKRVLLNFGVVHKLSQSTSLSASIGRDVHAGGDAPRRNYLSVAWQGQFGDKD